MKTKINTFKNISFFVFVLLLIQTVQGQEKELKFRVELDSAKYKLVEIPRQVFNPDFDIIQNGLAYYHGEHYLGLFRPSIKTEGLWNFINLGSGGYLTAGTLVQSKNFLKVKQYPPGQPYFPIVLTIILALGYFAVVMFIRYFINKKCPRGKALMNAVMSIMVLFLSLLSIAIVSNFTFLQIASIGWITLIVFCVVHLGCIFFSVFRTKDLRQKKDRKAMLISFSIGSILLAVYIWYISGSLLLLVSCASGILLGLCFPLKKILARKTT